MKKVFVLSALLYFTQVNAQWQQADCPFASKDRIECMATNGSTIFAGRYMGIFMSNDNGNTWSSKDMNAGYVVGFAFKGSSIFAAGNIGGVLLSNDSGSAWTAMNKGMPFNPQVNAIATDGTNIFAGVWNEGMYLSTDNGNNWTTINNGLTNQYVKSIAISGNNIFAGTPGGMYLSNNNGSSWTTVNTGLTSCINSIAIKDSNIFAATRGGVFLSTNNGGNWAPINTGLTNKNVNSLTINGSQIFAGTYSGGIFLSRDNGSSWTAVNESFPSTVNFTVKTYRGVEYLAANGTTLFAGTMDKGIWKRSLSEMTGIVDLKKKPSLSIYPNPTSNLLSVKGIFRNTRIKLYNAVGQLAYEAYADNDITFDISNLALGFYTFVAEDSNGSICNKVIVGK